MTAGSRQGHRLIAVKALRPIARCRVDPSQAGILFRGGDKEGACFVESEKSLKIEHVHTGNIDKTLDIATQVQQRTYFD